jgi:hypothetical protein
MPRTRRTTTTYVLNQPFGTLLNLCFLLFNVVMFPWVLLVIGILDSAPNLLANVPADTLALLKSVSPPIVFLTLFVGNGVLMALGMILPGTKIVTTK